MNRRALAVVLALIVVASVLTTATPAAAAGSTGVGLSPTDASIAQGETTTFDVVVENADGGVGAHSTTVSVGDPSVAEITDVQLHGDPPDSTTEVSIAADGSSASMTAALMNTTQDTGAVTVATVTVAGTGDGRTDLSLAVDALGDEEGVDYSVAGTNGASLAVGPVFEYSDLSVGPTSGTGSVTFTAEATVENTGAEAGTATVPLKVDGSTVDTQDVQLSPGASTTVSFEDTVSAPGDHDVTIDGLQNRTVSVNGPPTAALSAAPTAATVGETVAFDASGSTDEGTIVEYRWDFDGDGTVDSTTAGATTSHGYASPGAFDATVTVVDDAGATDAATTTVTVADETAPTAAFAVSPGEPIDVGASVSLDASGSSDNVGIERYEWDVGGPTGATLTGEQVTTSFDGPGTYTVELNVSDAAGNADATSRTVDVADLSPPTAAIAANATDATLSDAVGFDASASTDNHEITEYRWDFDGDGAVDDTTGAPTAAHRYSATGTYTATVTVVDAAGHVANATTGAIAVSDATSPIAAFTANETTVNVSGTVAFDASDSEDNVGIASYAWTFGDGAGASGATATHAYDGLGEFTVTLTVADTAGNEDSTSGTVTVVDDVPPSVSSATANATTAEVNVSVVEFEVAATDNHNVSAYRWDFDGDGVTDEETEDPVALHVYGELGEVTPEATVVDDSGNAATAAFDVVTVGDTTPPEVHLDGPDPAIVDVTSTFDAGASTDNYRIVEYRWDLDGDGSFERSTSEPTVTHEYTVANETVDVTVEAEDGSGNVDSASISVETTLAPSVQTTAPAAGEVVDTSEVPVTYVLDNLDASEETADVEYSVDGGPWQPTGNALDSPASITATGLGDGDHTVAFRIVDGSGSPLPFPSAVQSVDFTVDTTPPTVDAVNLADGQVVNGSATLVAEYGDETSGVNASAVRVLVDGSETDGASASVSTVTLDVGALGLTDGDHEITVEVADDAGLTTTHSLTVTLDTTSPSVEELSHSRATGAVSTNAPTTISVDVSEPHPAAATLRIENASTGEVVIAGDVTDAFDGGTELVWDATDGTNAPVPTGNYTAILVANDSVGHSTTEAIEITVDNTPPEIVSLAPANGSLLATSTPTAEVSYADAGSGVNETTRRLFADGDEVSLSGIETGGTQPASLSVPLGNLAVEDPDNSSHTIRFVVADAANNVAEATRTFTTDTAAPRLDLNASPAERVSANNPTTITVGRTDAHPNATTLAVRNAATGAVVDTRDLTGMLGSGSEGSATVEWNATDAAGNEVPSGGYDLVLQSEDAAGNANATTETVTVDNTDPTVEFDALNVSGGTSAAPSGQTFYTNDTVGLAATADGTPGDAEGVTFVLRATTFNFRTTADATLRDGQWTEVMELADVPDDGEYRAGAVAVDPARNTNDTTADATVVLDRTAPELGATISRAGPDTGRVNLVTVDRNPPEGAEAVNVTVTLANGTDVDVPVTKQDARGTAWQGTFALGDEAGEFSVVATGRDRAGNVGRATAETTIRRVSTVNRTVTVKLESSGVFVQFNTDEEVEDTFVTLTASDSPLQPLSPGLSGASFLNGELGSVLEGNLTNATIGIPAEEDKLPPALSVADATIGFYNETSGEWELLDDTAVRTVTLPDGTTDTYWIVDVDHFSTYGAVAQDQSPPTLQSLSPTADTEFPFGTSDVTVRIDYDDATSGVDAGEVGVEFDGTDVTDDAATQITSQYAEYDATGLGPGVYDAGVTVVDQAGNEDTFTTSFEIPADTTAPSLVAATPSDGTEFDAGTSRVALTVTFEDAESGVDGGATRVLLDGTEVTGEASIAAVSSSRAEVSYTATGLSDDTSHTFEVEMVDRDGNTVSRTVQFSIAAPEDDGDGSGGGGGGGGSSGDQPVGMQAITTSLSGTTPEARLPGGYPLTAVGFVGETELSASVNVEELPGPSGGAPPADVTFVTGADISFERGDPSAVDRVRLGIERSRLDALEVSPDQLTVFHLDAQRNEWNRIETTVVSTSASEVVVEAPSVGFSRYAVFASQETTTETAATTTGAPATETTPEPDATSTPPATTTTETPGGLDGFGIAVALVALLVAGLLASRRRG